MALAQFAYGKLPAQDLDRARRFYATALDLEPFGASEGHLYYDVEGTRFMIFASAGVPSGTHDQFGFVVDDLRARVIDLKAQGIKFETNRMTTDDIADFGRVRAAWFKDSEGNLISLIEGDSPLWKSATSE